MPRLFIHTRNSEFDSRDEGADYDDAELALASGVRSAIRIAADEISRGDGNAAVEVSVLQEDGTRLLRSVVVISVSPLMTNWPDNAFNSPDPVAGDEKP